MITPAQQEYLAQLSRRFEEEALLRAEGGRLEDIDGQRAFVSPKFSTTDPATISAIAQEIQAGGSLDTFLEKQMAQSYVQKRPLEAAAATFTRGIPFVGESIPEAVGLVSPESRAEMERLQEATATAFPKTEMAARTGAAISTAPAGGLIPGVARLEQMIKTPAQAAGAATAFGGAEGLISGIGAGEGDVGERFMQALPTAAVSALASGPIGFLTNIFARGFGTALSDRHAVSQVANELGISTDAATIIGQTLAREGASLDQAIANLRRAGETGMLADADKAIAAVLDASITAAGGGGVSARRAVTERVQEESAQLGAAMTRALGREPTGLRTAAEEAAARHAPITRLAYAEAYAQPIDYLSPAGQRIEAVLGRIPNQYKQRAFAAANDLMQIDGVRNQQMRAIIGDDGSVAFEEMPNVIQLDYLKRALQDIAYGPDFMPALATKPQGVGGKLNALAGELRGALGDAVPQYDQAVRRGGDAIRERISGELGVRLLSPSVTREEVMEAVRGASTTELNAMRLGLRNQIDEIMANVKMSINQGDDESVGAARRLLRDLSSAANKQKLEMLLPPQRYNVLMKKLTEIRAAFELQGEIAVGSKTGQRQDLLRMIDELTAPGAVRAAARGEPVQAGRRMIQFLTGETDEAMQARRSEIFKEVADALTTVQGRDAEEALMIVAEAMRKGRVSANKAGFVNRVLQRAAVPATSELAPMILLDSEQ